MPRLIVGVVDMKVARSASAPLVNIKGLPGRSDRRLVIGSHLQTWNVFTQQLNE